MNDPDIIATLADRLDMALTEVGSEMDDMRADLGLEPERQGEGSLTEPFEIARELAALAQAAKSEP